MLANCGKLASVDTDHAELVYLAQATQIEEGETHNLGDT